MRVRRLALVGLALALASGLAGCLGSEEGSSPVDEDGISLPDVDTGGNQSGTQAPEPRDERDNASTPGGFSDTDVFPGNYTTSGTHSETLQDGPHDPLPPRFVRLESPVDGVPIAVEIHRPEVPNGTPVPVLAAPSNLYGDLTSSPRQDSQYAENGLYTAPIVEQFVPHGYAVALVANRGTADSGGCVDPLSPDTRRDIDHAITWLADRNWSTGSVGVVGIYSQDGASAWQAAASGNPHVETVVPAASYLEFYERTARNGSVDARLAAANPLLSLAPVLAASTPESRADLETLTTRTPCPEHAEAAATSVHASTRGGSFPTGYWEARDVRDEVLDRYNGSVFLVHGLEDVSTWPSTVYPFANKLEASGTPVKHLLGQWGHAPPDDSSHPTVGDHVRWDFMEILLHWFDYWVKGDTSRDLGPRVQVEDVDGDWRSADAWPPTRANRTVFNLHPDGTLARPETSETGSAVLTAAPSQTALGRNTTCARCVTFATPPLDEPLRFAGLPHPHLTVTPTAPGGYLTADLLARSPDGDLEHLTGGQMDLRFADGDRSPERPTAGQSLVARMELQPQDAVVPEDGRLVLRISQGAHGPNPIAGRAPDEPAPVRLELGNSQSTLTLETFDVPEEAFFEPPGGDG